MEHKLNFAAPPPDMVPATLEDVRAAIDALNRVDLLTTSIEELKALIAPLFQGYVVTAPILDPGLQVYRIRKFPNAKPDHISALSVPPCSAVLMNQRCNRGGEPMFYCSSARQAPFFETHASVGEKLVLSEWKTLRKLLVNNVGYTVAALGTLNSNRKPPTWGKESDVQQETEFNATIHEYLAAKFTQDVGAGEDHRYKLTIALTEKLIHGGPLDGLLYPTIAMFGNADNLALTAACASEALSFTKAEYLDITKIDGLEISFTVLDTATALQPDGAIIWKGHADRWTLKGIGHMLQFTAKDGRWDVRDSSGNIVDPD